MSKARIYQPTKNAMQSGRANLSCWFLEFEPAAAKHADPLMGWSGSADTRRQVRLRFATAEDAVAYAARHGHEYSVAAPKERKFRPKIYSENFSHDRVTKYAGISNGSLREHIFDICTQFISEPDRQR